MFDSTGEILRPVRSGEDIRVPFEDTRFGKRRRTSPDTVDLAATIVAIVNGGTGTIILGR